ncbi:MAG: tRNA glutamyl-Q(34) synthetase GluQRS [Clostridia bacterium]|nr:tRNA glutamyl-Q(34) synthetase GluQRS [Clostridia bacterium]
MSAVVGRFAPSPSGRMHLGNVMSALLAWLSARSQGGRMVLRIEDIDPDRSRRAYAEQIMDDFAFLGLDWDDGPHWQSARTAAYEQALRALSAHTYPCYCSRAELHATQAPHASDGTFIYDGRCRDLTAAQRAVLAQSRRPAVRIRVPDCEITFVDGCRGPMAQNLARDCGDFILRRSDGAFAYQLAVVVDDAQMGVTQVVRGSDLLGSTPRQIWLHRLLGFEPPQYCHIPLLLAPDGRRLSKRERDLDMGALRRSYSAEEIIGKLAWLTGLQPAPEPVSAAELIPAFQWNRVKQQDIFLPDGLFSFSFSV